MGRAARVQFEGAKYHVMARGNWRAKIYNSPAAKQAYLQTYDWSSYNGYISE